MSVPGWWSCYPSGNIMILCVSAQDRPFWPEVKCWPDAFPFMFLRLVLIHYFEICDCISVSTLTEWPHVSSANDPKIWQQATPPPNLGLATPQANKARDYKIHQYWSLWQIYYNLGLRVEKQSNLLQLSNLCMVQYEAIRHTVMSHFFMKSRNLMKSTRDTLIAKCSAKFPHRDSWFLKLKHSNSAHARRNSFILCKVKRNKTRKAVWFLFAEKINGI